MGPYALQSRLVVGYHTFGLPVGSHGAGPRFALKNENKFQRRDVESCPNVYCPAKNAAGDKTAMKNVDA
jgi:hypothetical protein